MNSDQSTRTWRAARGTQAPACETVHFHIDADGWPFVCDYASCDSPGVAIAGAGSQEVRGARSVARRGRIRRMREVIHA